MNHSDLLLLGIKRNVVAISRRDGSQLWSTDLGGMAGAGFVTVISDGVCAYAYTAGHLHALDLATGEILWSNQLPGLGYGLATLCLPEGGSSPHPAAFQAMANAERSSSASTAGD